MLRRLAFIALAGGLVTCTKGDTSSGPSWRPGIMYASPSGPNARGLLDRRGLIHAHSVYSHDACDEEPVKDGVRDPVCFDDFRRGLCQSKHDFVMLTDHSDAFAETPFEETLLFRAERGDEKVMREGAPVASWAGCTDGRRALVMAGFEHGTMSVGLEHHAAPTPEARRQLYGSTEAEDIATVKKAGAVTLLQHTEDWSVQQLIEMPVDGFEMYNLHANTLKAAGTVLELLVISSERPEDLPHPDLIALPLWSEDPRYIERWGSALALGVRRVTTMGTDCHRNTFPALLPDGERVDSYRRMMSWFSNHLLVRPEADGSWDDRHVKAALSAGRLYGAFEMLGAPEGFDFVGQTRDRTVEMGEGVAFTDTPQLEVKMPRIRNLDPAVAAPELTVRLLRAVEGGFEVVATSEDDLVHTPMLPGAYRAEVRMVPRHLEDDLGQYRLRDLGDFVWIYSNAIYVD